MTSNYYIEHTNRLEECLSKNGYELVSYASYSDYQLNHCQAWLIRGFVRNTETQELSPCEFLQSYRTLVAVYIPDDSKIIHCGYWSATTSQHQSKFIKCFGGCEIIRCK